MATMKSLAKQKRTKLQKSEYKEIKSFLNKHADVNPKLLVTVYHRSASTLGYIKNSDDYADYCAKRNALIRRSQERTGKLPAHKRAQTANVVPTQTPNNDSELLAVMLRIEEEIKNHNRMCHGNMLAEDNTHDKSWAERLSFRKHKAE
jgi:hypothetical protein